MKARQIVGLDVLRLGAAGLVLFFHLGFWSWRGQISHPPVPAAYARFTPLFSQGWVGVEIFFVISGFVIAYSTEGTTATQFVRHRALRLLPAALVCSTVTACVLLMAYPVRMVAGQWIRSVSFFPVGPWIDGSYWTLPIEVAFYLFVWLQLRLAGGRYLEPFLAGLGCLSFAVCMAVVLNPAWVPPGLLSRLWMSGFPPGACLLLIHGVFFSLGSFLFLTLLRGVTVGRVLTIVVCTAGCVAELIWHMNANAFATAIPRRLSPPLLLWTGAVVLLIVSVKGNEPVRAWMGSGGALWVRRLGVATYPLYLLHAKVGQALIGALHRRVGYGPALVLACGLVGGLAVLVSEVFEPPVRRAVEGLWTGEAGLRAR